MGVDGAHAGPSPRSYVLPRSALDELLEAIRRREFRLIGPVVRDGVIVYADIGSAADLPVGWTDTQEAGSYRLSRRDDEAVFGYNVGPQGWKRWLFPPSERLAPAGAREPLALIGVRACELRAIAIQDQVLLDRDPSYSARRSGVFIVAVNCGQSASTCFCASMSSGPRVSSGHDLSLTELLDGAHRFLVEVGSSRGASVMGEVSAARPADPSDAAAASAAVSRAERSQVRAMPGGPDLRDLLYSNLENARWDDVANRCLSCGNCTMVCPTCYCFDVSDGFSSLASGTPERTRSWDSCFALGHSYQHGGPVRASTRARYRQWATHKLATWHDQFGTAGCVGCGRCIAWCPVGIDITEEIAAIAGEADDNQ
jgi:sulfhydrogenase subunit beta (sulfur reductase)